MERKSQASFIPKDFPNKVLLLTQSFSDGVLSCNPPRRPNFTLRTQLHLSRISYPIKEIWRENGRWLWLLFVSPKFFIITEGSFGISVTKGGKVIYSENYKLSSGYYPTIKSIVSSMFAKVLAGSRFGNLHKMESKFHDFSVDTISQRSFIKTMPVWKYFWTVEIYTTYLASCFRMRPQRLMIIFQLLRLFMIFNGSMQ